MTVPGVRRLDQRPVSSGIHTKKSDYCLSWQVHQGDVQQHASSTGGIERQNDFDRHPFAPVATFMSGGSRTRPL